MKLNKIFAIALCALCFTACSDDDDAPEVLQVYTGGYVLNQGNMSKNIPGSLTNIDTENGQVFQDVFQKANKRVLGDTPNSAIKYGTRIYVAGTESNTIEVMNDSTTKSLKTIIPNASAGKSPRCFAAKDRYVYVSMFDGYVSRIDTVSLNIDATIKVGPNPEEMAVVGNYLYVANSDGYNTKNNSVNGYVSKINLSTFTEEAKINAGVNTNKLVSNGKDIFVICTGNYDDIDPMLKQIDSDGNVEELFPASYMAINGDKLYFVYAPYPKKGQPAIPPTYYEYVISTKVKTELQLTNIISPVAIGVNPSTGNIFVSSYSVEYGYSDPCIVNEYSSTGTFLKKYDVGVGAGCFVF